MKKNAQFVKIKPMIRYIRMWRLVRYVYRKRFEKNNSFTQDEVLEMIIEGNSPALAKKFHLKKYAELHFRTLERIDSLVQSAVKRGFVEETYYGGEKMIRTTPQGDDFTGYMPLLQGLLSEFPLAWSIIIIPFFTGIYGKEVVHWAVNSANILLGGN